MYTQQERFFFLHNFTLLAFFRCGDSNLRKQRKATPSDVAVFASEVFQGQDYPPLVGGGEYNTRALHGE